MKPWLFTAIAASSRSSLFFSKIHKIGTECKWPPIFCTDARCKRCHQNVPKSVFTIRVPFYSFTVDCSRSYENRFVFTLLNQVIIRPASSYKCSLISRGTALHAGHHPSSVVWRMNSFIPHYFKIFVWPSKLFNNFCFFLSRINTEIFLDNFLS